MIVYLLTLQLCNFIVRLYEINVIFFAELKVRTNVYLQLCKLFPLFHFALSAL